MNDRPRFHSTRGGVPTGCLIAIGIFVLLLVIAGITVALKWKSLAVSLTTTVAEKVIAESGLPLEQREQIMTEIKKLGEDFKAGRISSADLERVMKEIASSPLIQLGGVQFARQVYIERSNMTPPEKAAAVRSVQRFARGAFEKKIPQAAIEEALAPIKSESAGGKTTFKENLTREELDQFVALLKKKADDAGVADEAFEMNIAAELKKAIDGALKRP